MKTPKEYFCQKCGKLIQKGYTQRKLCLKCYPRTNNTQKTLKELKKKYPQLTDYHSVIRAKARRAFEQSDVPKKCCQCGYDKHIQVCHKKPVSAFPMNTKLSTVNSIHNLVALCPNHHWELDNGLLTLK